VGYVLLDPAHQSVLETTKKGRPAFLKRADTLLAILLGTCLAVAMFLNFIDPLQILLNEGRTTGETVERYIGAKGSLNVTYRYTVDDVVYTRTSRASRELYDAAPNRTDLPVVYARHNPSLSELGDVSPLGVACMGVLSISCILGLILAGLSALGQRVQGPAHRILRGTLREISLTKTTNGTLWRLQYDFVSPRYKTIVGHYTLLSTPHQTVPSVGASLAILYQDDHIHHPL
jgi:hypothetical protein